MEDRLESKYAFDIGFTIKKVYRMSIAADKLNTLKLLSKNVISPKRIMVLCCAVNFEQF